MRTIFDDLDHEWSTVAGSGKARRALQHWAYRESALRGLSDLDHLVEYVQRRHPAAVTDPIFGALLRTRHDLARRTVLQALLPGLRACAAAIHTHGEFPDTAATVVAACWQRICVHPIEHRHRAIARYLLLDVKQLVHRHLRDNSVFTTTTSGLPAEPIDHVNPSPSDELLDHLLDAVRAGGLPIDTARLIAATRVAGVRFDSLSVETGRSESALRKERARAERRLVAAKPVEPIREAPLDRPRRELSGEPLARGVA